MRTLLASLSLVLILVAPGIIFIHANLPRLRAQVTPGTELPKIEIGLPTESDSERVTPSDQDVPVIDSEKQFLTYENTKYGFSILMAMEFVNQRERVTGFQGDSLGKVVILPGIPLNML